RPAGPGDTAGDRFLPGGTVPVDLLGQRQGGRDTVRQAPLAVAGSDVDVSATAGQGADRRDAVMGGVVLGRPGVRLLGPGEPPLGPDPERVEVRARRTGPADRVPVAADEEQPP